MSLKGNDVVASVAVLAPKGQNISEDETDQPATNDNLRQTVTVVELADATKIPKNGHQE
jgi:hypothetical protein